MQSLFQVLPQSIVQTSKSTSERATIIEQIVEELNQERPYTYKNLKGKLKVVEKTNGKEVACRVSHLKENGMLYALLSNGKDYKARKGSFGRYFNFITKKT